MNDTDVVLVEFLGLDAQGIVEDFQDTRYFLLRTVPIPVEKA